MTTVKEMSKLYYEYLNQPVSTHYRESLDDVLTGVKRSATSIAFYKKLAKAAPNPKQREDILQAIEKEKDLWRKFTQLYIDLTGRHPVYETKNVTFLTFEGGLKKALERAIKDYEEYRNSYVQTQYFPYQDIFLKACENEADQAKRFQALSEIKQRNIPLRDYGKQPLVINIDVAAEQNDAFRTTLWTGNYLQVTLMSIDVGDDIGVEMHPDVDQFLRIEEGKALVQIGNRRDSLNYKTEVHEDYAIMVPAGTWHNIINTGNKPLKLYSIYAPPEHPFGTIDKQKPSHAHNDSP